MPRGWEQPPGTSSERPLPNLRITARAHVRPAGQLQRGVARAIAPADPVWPYGALRRDLRLRLRPGRATRAAEHSGWDARGLHWRQAGPHAGGGQEAGGGQNLTPGVFVPGTRAVRWGTRSKLSGLELIARSRDMVESVSERTVRRERGRRGWVSAHAAPQTGRRTSLSGSRASHGVGRGARAPWFTSRAPCRALPLLQHRTWKEAHTQHQVSARVP